MTFRLRAGELDSLLGVIEFNRTMSGTSGSGTGNLPRRWDVNAEGQPVLTAYLLGAESNQRGLPSLGDLRENYRTMSGGTELPVHELFKNSTTGPELLSALAANAADTAAGSPSPDNLIRTIWNQNHNYWVDRLRADTGGTWTEDQYFQAARAMNSAEHQQAAFSEIASALSDDTSARLNQIISASQDAVTQGLAAGEALVALFHEQLDVLDGTTGERHRLALADTFDMPAADPAAAGTKQTAVPEPATPDTTDMAALPGSRTGLPDRPIDLATVYSTRTRDNGSPGLNQVRNELFALTGLASLQPYVDWADFQGRNGLSDDVVADLKAAYPEGVEAVDLWVGGLAEAPSHGQFGSTFGMISQTESNAQTAQSNEAISVSEFFAETADIQHLGSQSFAALVARHFSPDSPEFQALFDTEHPASVIVGNDLNNILTGTRGRDLILGGGGDDVLSGRSGDDDLQGGAGDDLLDGGIGADTMSGNGGDDTFIVDNEGDTVVETADQGADTVVTTLNTYTLSENVEVLVFAGEGTFTGTGNAADNTIIGGSSSDQLSGETGSDTLIGGGGNDTYIVDTPSDIILELEGEGTDTVVANVENYTLSINVENLEYSGAGNFVGTGNLSDNTILGGEGTDILFGLSGDDTLSGDLGSDVLAGGAGNDLLAGGEGNDVLYGDEPDISEPLVITGGSSGEIILGSAEIDHISGNSGGDIVFGGAGADAIDGGRDHDQLDGGAGNDYLDGGSGDDDLAGGTGNDVLYGSRGNDTLQGGDGDDRLEGGDDDDCLDGGQGDDWLEGGYGRNLFTAGQGTDWIITISGSDTIVLQSGFGNDYVAGFDGDSSGQGSQDLIDVSSYGFNSDAIGFDIQILGIGSDTVITIGSDTLTLLNVASDTIDRNDFIFS